MYELPHLVITFSPVVFQSEQVLATEEATAVRTSHKSHLETQLSEVASYKPGASMLEQQWSEMVWPASSDAIRSPTTGMDTGTLGMVGRASVAVPDGFVSSQAGFPPAQLRLICRAGNSPPAPKACKASPGESRVGEGDRLGDCRGE